MFFGKLFDAAFLTRGRCSAFRINKLTGVFGCICSPFVYPKGYILLDFGNALGQTGLVFTVLARFLVLWYFLNFLTTAVSLTAASPSRLFKSFQPGGLPRVALQYVT